MDPLSIVSSIASLAQLIQFTVILSSGTLDLIDSIHGFPEEVRRLKLTLTSLNAKLEIIADAFGNPSNSPWLSHELCKKFTISFLEVQRDVEAVATMIKKHMTSVIYQGVHLEAKKDTIDPQPIQYISRLINYAVRSRIPLVHSRSFLRYRGFYGWLIKETGEKNRDSQTTFCLGVCIPAWLMMPSVSLALSLIAACFKDGWNIQWSLRVQHRVSITSPLMKACRDGDVVLMRQILIERQGSIDDRSMCLGKTPLLVAIHGKQFEAVKFLLEQGADPNIADDDQVLPLFAVVGMDPTAHPHFEQIPPKWDRWLDTFRLLIKHRALVFETVRGRSLAGLNVERDNVPSRTLEYLRILAVEDVLQLDIAALGRQCWPALHNALRCKHDALDILKLFRSSGIGLSAIMRDGKTALHVAAELCANSETLEFLFENGCSEHINRKDQWGWTPLHYALIGRRSADGTVPYSNAVMLLRKGADPTLKGSSNKAYIYDQPTESFTAQGLLRHVRPERFKVFEQVLRNVSIGIAVANEDLQESIA